MLNTTFNKLKKAGACTEEYKKLGYLMGGITKYGKDKPIPLTIILDMFPNGLSNTIWSLRCCLEPESERLARIFACDSAERVLPIYEKQYPDDKRLRKSIDISRLFADGKVSEDELAAASAAAWDAASAAAWDAAWAASAAASDSAWAASAAASAAWDAARAAAWDATAAAWDAASAAAWDAASAAWDAARDAARDAEMKWQIQHLKDIIL